ncbi:MAG: arginine repressor [Ancrocorticia sp.]|jgi:transcriptional regulator of arginine metabolism|nr:arginine repressor [Ancrocorticia sp.]MCI1895812.1 arginine repressor [Ancrocorticia sp.]MCI1932636.1 arginine repressor [Ancrocorticia sp.]MCI1964303.1 arginine repressor [Ancrocorticia sp.]MCI2002906.1 arginine repressor [Ancrocorticia sp.]
MEEPFIPVTRTARQALIQHLLATESISSQHELRERLQEEGIRVTQATLSRDLDDLGAYKAKAPDGRQVYKVEPDGPQTAAPSVLERWGIEVLQSVQQAGNQLVLRTPPGAAQLLALGIDRARIDGILGSIAGDDTVLVIARDEAAASAFRASLRDLK